jgi:hypothetical protein
MNTFNTPILFIIFNRPNVTKRVFERIRAIKPSRLYVAADGPREFKNGEYELCQEARSIVNAVDWPCEVKKLYRQNNLGCGKAVSDAISWFFMQEEMGIILEDDVQPDLSFFAYCAELLERFKDDKKVMHINGCNFQNGIKRGNGSYYFSAFPHVWGWAGWRRAWSHYDFNLSDLNFFYNQKKMQYYFSDKTLINSWHEIFFKMNRKWLDTWDYQWNYAIWNNQGKVISPNVNLISNIGFGADATHTIDTDSRYADLGTASLPIIEHPETVTIDKEADSYTYNYWKQK